MNEDEATNVMAKMLEMRIAVDVLEDVLLDELRRVEQLLASGADTEALELIRHMIRSVETESVGEPDAN